MEWIKVFLKERMDRNKYDHGAMLYKTGAVGDAYAKKDNNELVFYGTVHDEYHRQNYSCMLRLDGVSRRILESSCDCHQMLNRQIGPELCGHTVAIAYKGIDVLGGKAQVPEEKEVIMPEVSLTIGGLRKGMFDLDLELEGIPKSEYRKIFTSYKSGNKLCYIGEGKYINLEEERLRESLSLIDLLGVYNEIEKMKVPETKALFLEEAIRDLDFVSGKEAFNERIQKLHKKKLELNIPETIQTLLRPYQAQGVSFLTTLASLGLGGILADEMGLGKTLQVIAFLAGQKDKKSLIITPTALIYNWKNELMRFAPMLKVAIVHGNKVRRQALLEAWQDYDIVLTTYTTYRNDEALYQDKVFDYCIIDEAQQIKNPDAQLTKTIKGIKSQIRFALTGTPLENNLMEIWSIMDFVMPGYLYSRLRFQNIFMSEGAHIEDLRRLIAPMMLRRTKKEVLTELPERLEEKLMITLDPYHQKAYLALSKLIKERLKGEKAGHMALLAYLTKLRQLCLMPEQMVKAYKGTNGKLDYLVDLLNSMPDQKVLVFSQFTTVLGLISARLESEGIGYSYLDGQTEAHTRIKTVEAFNQGEGGQVFLISLKAGGTGLNLTSASTVIHFDPWWNPAVEDQASSRAHRMGQKEIVTVIKLVAAGTIEERVIALQESKKALIEEVLNGKETTDLSKLSEEELMALLLH